MSKSKATRITANLRNDLDIRRWYQEGRQYLWQVAERVAASDVKTERLLNLVLALLSSKRYLTKSQITSMVPGYEGSAESRDRMFERDKDDLRKIGLEIEVNQIDPLFEDEVGYRIRREGYSIQIPELTSDEGLVVSIALSLVGQLAHQSDAKRAGLKLGAITSSGTPALQRILSTLPVDNQALTERHVELNTALHSRKTVLFDYIRDSDGKKETRKVAPLELLRRSDEWLLKGWDFQRSALRYFLLENIVSGVELTSEAFNPEQYAKEEETGSSVELVVTASIDAADRIQLEGGSLLEVEGAHCRVRFDTFNIDRLLRILLAIDPNVSVVSPEDAQRDLVRLKKRITDAI